VSSPAHAPPAKASVKTATKTASFKNFLLNPNSSFQIHESAQENRASSLIEDLPSAPSGKPPGKIELPIHSIRLYSRDPSLLIQLIFFRIFPRNPHALLPPPAAPFPRNPAKMPRIRKIPHFTKYSIL
jgi:hypothetical protein